MKKLADWKSVALGELCRVVEGQVDPRDPEYRDLPHINGEVVESGTGKLLQNRTAAEDGLISGKYLFEPGMILYSKLRPYLRKVTIAPYRGVCSADMYPLMFDPERVDPDFAVFSLLAEPFTTYAVDQSRRARMPKLNRDQLLAWQMPFPESLADQRRIAKQLKESLAAVDVARRAAGDRLVAAESLPAAYLQQVFAGPGASRWPVFPLGSLVQLVNGRAYAQEELLETGTPVIRIQNLNGGDRWYYSDLALHPKNYCEAGDLLFAWSASFGPYWWQGPRAIFHYHIWKVVTGPNLDRQFAYQLLRWITAAVKATSHGVAMLHVTKGHMEQWKVAVPPVDEQRRVADDLSRAVAAADSLSARCREERAEIEALAVALLRAVFSRDC